MKNSMSKKELDAELVRLEDLGEIFETGEDLIYRITEWPKYVSIFYFMIY